MARVDSSPVPTSRKRPGTVRRAAATSRSFSSSSRLLASPVRAEGEEAGEVVGGERLEASGESLEVEPAVRVERRDERRDHAAQRHGRQAAGVFLASACATRPSSFTSCGEKAPRKSLQTSTIAQSPASVRTGATIALPLTRPDLCPGRASR